MPNDLLRKLRPLKITLPPVRWLRHLIPLILIGLGVHILLPQLSNLQEALQTIQRMPRWLVFMGLAAQVASYSGSGYMLSSLASMLDERLAVLRGMLLTLAGNSLGVLVGLVVSSAAVYRWAYAGGVSSQVAALCGALPVVFYNLVLAVLAVLGLLHLFIIHQLTTLQAVTFGLILGILGLLLVVGVWGVTHPNWLFRLLDKLARRWAKIRKRPYSPEATENNVNQLVDTWIILRSGGWRGPALGVSLMILFDMLSLYFLFTAAGYPVTFGALLTGYGLSLLIGRVSFFPGGIGIVEATMTAVYASLGIPPNVIVVAILGYRLIAFWTPTVLGFPAIFYLQQRSTGKRRAPQPVENP